mmetsp:Transcript_24705/g.60648  ORF Transcript_24705/g.60648 Transcript_24705/m.60648 type:complete len:302 (+) Transcript_24705:211-1116(+)
MDALSDPHEPPRRSRPLCGLMVALPLATLLTALLSISVSCTLALELGHVPAWPQVSMCGMYPPERYVFSLGLSSVSFLLACLLVINHVRTEQLSMKSTSLPPSAWYSGTQLGAGLSSALSLALMATVPVAEMPAPHVMFAVSFFGMLLVSQALNAWARVRGAWRGTRAASWAAEAWMFVFFVATLLGFVLWQATGRALPQYLAVAGVMLHFLPYIWELRDTTIAVRVRGSEEDEEASSCLRDADRVPERHQRVRGAPLAIAALVVVIICGGLAFVISQVTAKVEANQAESMHSMQPRLGHT